VLQSVRRRPFFPIFQQTVGMVFYLGLIICACVSDVLMLVGTSQVAMPSWAWGCLCAAIVAVGIQTTVGYGNVAMGLTDMFLRASEALVLALRHLEVFCYSATARGTTVDWAATYKNYDSLCASVEEFSRAWRAYFFMLEFASVPAAGLGALGMVRDLRELLGALDTPPGAPLPRGIPVVLRIASVVQGGAYSCMWLCLIVAMWLSASRITEASGGPRLQGMAAISEAATLGDGARPEDGGPDDRVYSEAAADLAAVVSLALRQQRDEDRRLGMDVHRERARGFVAYTELCSPGFACHGITISFRLGMLLLYPLVTFALTLAFPLVVTLIVPHELPAITR